MSHRIGLFPGAKTESVIVSYLEKPKKTSPIKFEPHLDSDTRKILDQPKLTSAVMFTEGRTGYKIGFDLESPDKTSHRVLLSQPFDAGTVNKLEIKPFGATHGKSFDIELQPNLDPNRPKQSYGAIFEAAGLLDEFVNEARRKVLV